MADKVYMYDYVKLVLDTRKVLTTFTDLRIKFKRPDGTSGRWAATIDPANSRRLYTTGYLFDMEGNWKVQAWIYKVGERYHGYWADIKVYDALADTTTVPPTTLPPTT